MPEPVEGTTFGASTSSATEGKTQRLNDSKTQSEDSASLRLCGSASSHESQIRKADSLYKNYLPQYNFDEVKAAMEFFDSLQLSKTTDNRQRTIDFVHRIFSNRKQKDLSTVPEPVEGITFGASTSSATSFSRTVDRCPLSVDFNCAKAHYYHAVGLTEKDDIVGACEHYLIALEIMEKMMANGKRLKSKGKKSVDCCPLSVDNNEDYEKIRFVALIYTRLGELFHNEACTSIAIEAYKNCIIRYMSLNDTIAFANCYKQLGETYIMEDNYDSSLYFYKKSIESLYSKNNQIARDSWKGISAILHHYGEIDSSYRIIYNLISTTNGDEQYAYKTQLAQMYYKDEVYDSALIYFKDVLNRDNKYTKISSANYISKIYSGKGEVEKSNYFQNLYSDELIEEFNRTSQKSQLMKLYNDYIYKKKFSAKSDKRNYSSILIIILTLCLFTFLIFLKHRLKKNVDNSHKTCAKTFEDCIDEFKKEIIFTKIRSVKNEYIKSTETNGYKELQLSKDDKEIFIDSINKCFNEYATKLAQQYPSLNTIDLIYCCLVFLGLENKEIGALMGVQYQSVKDRLRKLSTTFNTDELNSFVKNKYDEFLSI